MMNELKGAKARNFAALEALTQTGEAGEIVAWIWDAEKDGGVAVKECSITKPELFPPFVSNIRPLYTRPEPAADDALDRNSLCLLIEQLCPRRDEHTDIALGWEVEALADAILATLTRIKGTDNEN